MRLWILASYAVMIKGLIAPDLEYQWRFPLDGELFRKLLDEVFPTRNCLQVSFEDSPFADLVLAKLHNSTSLNPVALRDYFNRYYLGECRFYVFIAERVESLIEQFGQNLYQRRIRFLGIHKIESEQSVKKFLDENGKSLFGSVYGYVLMFSKPLQLYEYNGGRGEIERINITQIKVSSNAVEGKTLKVGTFNCSLYSKFGPLNEEGIPEWTRGVEMTFFHDLSRQLNFSYRIIEPGASIYGNITDGRWKGLKRMTSENEVDVSFCAIWYTENLFRHAVTISTAVTATCMKLLVRHPKEAESRWYGLFRSFHLDVWILILISNLYFSFWMFFADFLQQRLRGSSQKSTSFHQLWDNILIPFRILFYGGVPISEGSNRFIFTGCSIFALVFSTCFSCSLISNLTHKNYEPIPNSVADLVDGGYFWGLSYRPTISDYLHTEMSEHEVFAKRLIILSPKNLTKLAQSNEKFTMVGLRTNGIFEPSEIVAAEEMGDFVALEGCINKYYFGFIFPFDSPYVSIFDVYIQRYEEAGLFMKKLGDLVFREIITKPNMRTLFFINKMPSTDLSHVALKLNSFRGLFIVWAVGLAISGLVFILEILSFNMINVNTNFKESFLI